MSDSRIYFTNSVCGEIVSPDIAQATMRETECFTDARFSHSILLKASSVGERRDAEYLAIADRLFERYRCAGDPNRVSRSALKTGADNSSTWLKLPLCAETDGALALPPP